MRWWRWRWERGGLGSVVRARAVARVSSAKAAVTPCFSAIGAPSQTARPCIAILTPISPQISPSRPPSRAVGGVQHRPGCVLICTVTRFLGFVPKISQSTQRMMIRRGLRSVCGAGGVLAGLGTWWGLCVSGTAGFPPASLPAPPSAPPLLPSRLQSSIQSYYGTKPSGYKQVRRLSCLSARNFYFIRPCRCLASPAPGAHLLDQKVTRRKPMKGL